MWKQYFKKSLDLELLETTTFNRPYLPNSKADFNISHAGKFVICALGSDMKLGIDIEDRKEVDFNDFTRTMNSPQWDQILTSEDPYSKFFEYWSIKESAIKADGRGLSIPLTEITINSGTVSYADKAWHIKSFKLDPEHFGCLACNQRISDFNIERVQWNNL
jgi:4'-phosphopantetheinyl transferase